MEKIADFDLSENPALAVQRDIFVFQCLIGCRVSDLMRMTDNSVIDGAVEYIPPNKRHIRPLTSFKSRLTGSFEKESSNRSSMVGSALNMVNES